MTGNNQQDESNIVHYTVGMVTPDSTGAKPTKFPHWLKLAAAIFSVYLIWGSTYLFIKFSMDGMPPFFMAGTRFLTAGLLMFSWSAWHGMERLNRKQWLAATIIGGLLLMGGNGGVAIAVQLVPTGLVSLLVSIVPIWITLLDWWRPGGTAPRIPVIIGLVLGLAGIALLIGPGNLAGGGSINLVGTAAIMISTLCWSFGSLYSRHAPRPESAFLATSMQMLAGGTMLLITSYFMGETAHLDITHVSMKVFLSMVYLIIFGGIVGFTAYIWLLNNVSASVAATYAYINPVVAVFLGWAFAGEEITPRTLIAAAIIITAVAIITGYQGRNKQQHDEEIDMETPGPAAGPQVPPQHHPD